MKMRNADGEIINTTVTEMLKDGERRADIARAIANDDSYHIQSVEKVLNKIGPYKKALVLTSLWILLKGELIRNRWLLKHRKKDEYKLCMKKILFLYEDSI